MLAPAVSVVATINYHNCHQNIKKILLLRDESTNRLVLIFSSTCSRQIISYCYYTGQIIERSRTNLNDLATATALIIIIIITRG